MKVRKPVAGQHPQVNLGVALGKVPQLGDQPFRSKGWRYADREMGWRRAQQPRGFVDHRQGAAHAGAVGLPGIGQAKATRQTFEQANVQAGLQPANLLGNGRLGDAEFLGSQAKVQVTRYHFEHP